MKRFAIVAALLAATVTPAVGQMDEDLARRLREAQERLDRANAALKAVPKPQNQFDPDAVRRLDQQTARENADKAAAEEKARQEWERMREQTRSHRTTCIRSGNMTSCTSD